LLFGVKVAVRVLVVPTVMMLLLGVHVVMEVVHIIVIVVL